jgi:hypothetical protein
MLTTKGEHFAICLPKQARFYGSMLWENQADGIADNPPKPVCDWMIGLPEQASQDKKR